MGNTCCRPSPRVSPDVEPHVRSRIWRLKQALGLGKFCATVDVERDTDSNSQQPTGSSLKSPSSISAMIREDRALLFCTSSLIGMLDNDEGEAERDKHNARQCDRDIASEPTTNGLNVDQSQHDKDVEGATSDVEDSIASTSQMTTYLDYNGNIVTTPTSVKVTDGNKPLAEEPIACAKKDGETEKCSSPVSNHCILINRRLSPLFFSLSANTSYDEFKGEVEDEVEENIKAGDEQDKSGNSDMIRRNTESRETIDESAIMLGQGKVHLDNADIKMAISRLAFLKDGIDPENETSLKEEVPTVDSEQCNNYITENRVDDTKSLERKDCITDTQKSDTRDTDEVEKEDVNKLSETSVKSSISLAAALSLDTIKSHKARSDCLMSFFVRSPQGALEPRKIEVRASAKQIKDGSAEKHLKLLSNIHQPTKPVSQTSLTAKRSKKHLFTIPALAVQDDIPPRSWVQKQGDPGLTKLHSVPSFYEPTTKALNAREKLGLEQLQKFKIGVQCKPIERIKIDAEEFPGILPPKIRAKWKQKMVEKKHIN